MTEPELRAYALRGLTARLTELDDERARILVLLGEWGPAAGAGVRRRVRTVPHQDVFVGTGDTVAAAPIEAGAPAPPAELEVARILPRRNRVPPPAPVEAPAPVLPPMPRLVKARAS